MAQLFADKRRKMAAGLLVAVSLLSTGCGRRGDPERPPSAAVLSPGEEGEVVEATPSKDRPFILDGLIQ